MASGFVKHCIIDDWRHAWVKPLYETGFQPLEIFASDFLGLCPRLVWIAPLALGRRQVFGSAVNLTIGAISGSVSPILAGITCWHFSPICLMNGAL